MRFCPRKTFAKNYISDVLWCCLGCFKKLYFLIQKQYPTLFPFPDAYANYLKQVHIYSKYGELILLHWELLIRHLGLNYIQDHTDKAVIRCSE